MLKPEELQICNELGEIWNHFIRLTSAHPDDAIDFKFHIHALQNIVMARSAQRAHRDAFNTTVDE